VLRDIGNTCFHALITSLRQVRRPHIKELSVEVRSKAKLSQLIDALKPHDILLHLRTVIGYWDDPAYVAESAEYRAILHQLRSLHNKIHKLTARVKDPSLLGPTLDAVQTHGNIRLLSITMIIEGVEAVRTAAAAFTQNSFLGLEKMRLGLGWVFSRSLDDEEKIEISSTLATAVSHALRGNCSIQALRMNTFFWESETLFREFVTSTIPSMPCLQVVDFEDLYMNNERAMLFLKAAKMPSKLRKIQCGPSWGSVSAELVAEINYHCELNRIGFSHLLVADSKSIPVALWPTILANVHELSTVFTLLREKNDVLVHSGSGRAPHPSQHFVCLGCMIL
jgi:hypothetical protein